MDLLQLLSCSNCLYYAYIVCLTSLSLCVRKHWSRFFVFAATMLPVWNTLGTSNQICRWIYICMTMLRHFTIKFVTKPLSSTHSHLCLLIWIWWLMHSRQLLLELRKNSKHWLLIIKYRSGLSYYALFVVLTSSTRLCYRKLYKSYSIACFSFCLRTSKYLWHTILKFSMSLLLKKKEKSLSGTWTPPNLWNCWICAGSNWFTQ